RAKGEVQAALKKHVGTYAKGDDLWAARKAGEMAERAGEDIEQAVKDAFAGLPPSGTSVPPIKSLKDLVNSVSRRMGKDVELLELALARVLTKEVLKDPRKWEELFNRVDRLAELKQALMMEMGLAPEDVPVPP